MFTKAQLKVLLNTVDCYIHIEKNDRDYVAPRFYMLRDRIENLILSLEYVPFRKRDIQAAKRAIRKKKY